MSGGDAVRAYELLEASTAIAMHFGTFRQGEDVDGEPVDSLARAVKAAQPCAVRIWALYNGAAREVPPVSASSPVSFRASAAQPCHSERAQPNQRASG